MDRKTYEQAREFLRGYRQAVMCAQDAVQRLAEFRERNAGLKAIRLSDMPKAQGTPQDLSTYAAELDELERNIETAVRVYIHQAQEVEAVIEQIDDADQQRLLRLRYLSGRRFEKIADAMHLSRRHMFRLHRAAVEAVADKLALNGTK